MTTPVINEIFDGITTEFVLPFDKLPTGEKMGVILGGLSYNWILIPIGFVLGFTAVFAEPAVKVLIYEVDKVSGGYIPEKVMLFTLSTGVALSIALSMARIIYGFPFWYLVLPGYLIALFLIRYSKKNFVAIAFDSGRSSNRAYDSNFYFSYGCWSSLCN